MTDRLTIAAMAMQGIMSQSRQGPESWQDFGHGWGEDTCHDMNKYGKAMAATVAGFALQMADALIALERETDAMPQKGASDV